MVMFDNIRYKIFYWILKFNIEVIENYLVDMITLSKIISDFKETNWNEPFFHTFKYFICLSLSHN